MVPKALGGLHGLRGAGGVEGQHGYGRLHLTFPRTHVYQVDLNLRGVEGWPARHGCVALVDDAETKPCEEEKFKERFTMYL